MLKYKVVVSQTKKTEFQLIIKLIRERESEKCPQTILIPVPVAMIGI